MISMNADDYQSCPECGESPNRCRCDRPARPAPQTLDELEALLLEAPSTRDRLAQQKELKARR